MPVKLLICEQASNTLHRINRAILFTENSAMASFRDILRSWGPANPLIYSSKSHGFTKLSMRLIHNALLTCGVLLW